MSKILDNKYYDLIISNSLVPIYNTSDNITQLNELHSLLHIPIDDKGACDLGENAYHLFPNLYTLEASVSVEKSGIGSVQQSPGFGVRGRGVIVGVVDTGIDYRHPAFMFNDRTSRILSIWDQTAEDGTPPRGLPFGAEYTKENINFALLSDDPLSIVPVVDTNRHGTAIASIMAGRPNEEHSFSGVVPDADILVVKLKEAKDNLKKVFFVPKSTLCYQESDIILGIRFLVTTAQRLNRPIAICIALGSSQGGHDGRGPLSDYLERLVQSPRIGVALSAGNEGNNLRHYYGDVQSPPYISEFNLRVGSYDKQFSMEIWPYMPSRISISISTPSRETSQVIPPALGVCQKITFQSSQATLWVNNISLEQQTGDQVIIVRFENPDPGIWSFQITNSDNEAYGYHCWLPAGNFISNETFFLNADPNTTITSPGNTLHPLTVTAYNQLNDTIINESSRGYTRLGQIKPDVAAPGFQVPCAIPDNQYGTITGTGAAAAHATGVLAMVLEWASSRGNYTAVTGNQANRLIIRGARRDSEDAYPNNIWGYGQLDAEKVFNQIGDNVKTAAPGTPQNPES